MSRGNHHIIIGITDHHGHLGEIGHEVRKGTETINTTASLLIRIVVALAVASCRIE